MNISFKGSQEENKFLTEWHYQMYKEFFLNSTFIYHFSSRNHQAIYIFYLFYRKEWS